MSIIVEPILTIQTGICYTFFLSMPLSKQAIKKMRHDKTVTKRNKVVRTDLSKAVKAMRKKPTTDLLTKAFSVIDKATKRNVIHRNTASRLKSRLSTLLAAK